MLWLLAVPSAAPEAALRLTQFHAVGLVAVLTLLVTGTINSYFLVGTPAWSRSPPTTGSDTPPALARNVFAGVVSDQSVARLPLR